MGPELGVVRVSLMVAGEVAASGTHSATENKADDLRLAGSPAAPSCNATALSSKARIDNHHLLPNASGTIPLSNAKILALRGTTQSGPNIIMHDTDSRHKKIASGLSSR
jgi:hypothetical protein